MAWAGLAGAALIAVATLLLVGLDGALVTDVNLNGPLVAEDECFTVQPLELAQGPLYLVLAGALGVLLGSWTRHVYAAAFGALVLFLPPAALIPWFVFDDVQSRGFFGAVQSVGVGGNAAIGRQLFGLGALAACVAAGALARHDRRFVVLAVGALGLALLALGLLPGDAPPLTGPPPGAGPPPALGP